ncbi:uncharacterized protein LOC122267139 isoform X2 [Penaeus japonicus]|nr:uncharacterized protein LOC122267139 isoform X2 [Penaeus japonicus]
MDRDKDIGYSLLTPEDFDQVTTFIDEDFLTREPLNLGAHPRNLGAHSTASSASGATGWYLTKCLASGVSFGARDFKTGALVGARLAYIKTKTDLADEESADEKKTELESRGLSVIEEVGSKVNLFQDPDVEKVLYMYLLSVRRDFCNRGIGTKLVQQSTHSQRKGGRLFWMSERDCRVKDDHRTRKGARLPASLCDDHQYAVRSDLPRPGLRDPVHAGHVHTGGRPGLRPVSHGREYDGSSDDKTPWITFI